MKSSLNETTIKIDNQSTILRKNNQLISKLTKEVKDLTEEVKDLKNENTKLCIKVNLLSTKIDIIGCRDFLRKIILDFCYFFDVVKYDNFKEAAALINEKIKQKRNDTSLQEFEKKVNLIKFIECLGRLIDDSDNLSHLFFKELSINYKNQNRNQITNVENITKNINKCKDIFNDYTKINFDSVFSFFINDCNYPYYLINNFDIEEKDWLKAIKKNINKK